MHFYVVLTLISQIENGSFSTAASSDDANTMMEVSSDVTLTLSPVSVSTAVAEVAGSGPVFAASAAAAAS